MESSTVRIGTMSVRSACATCGTRLIAITPNGNKRSRMTIVRGRRTGPRILCAVTRPRFVKADGRRGDSTNDRPEGLMTNSETLPAPALRKVWRRIGAVLVGILVVIMLDVGLDVVIQLTGVYPPLFQPMASSLFLIATAYRMMDGVIGGYVAGRLAPDRPLAHALVLGMTGFVLSTIGAIVTWNMQPPPGPRWYSIALMVISI